VRGPRDGWGWGDRSGLGATASGQAGATEAEGVLWGFCGLVWVVGAALLLLSGVVVA
jgi:hypothetical protein